MMLAGKAGGRVKSGHPSAGQGRSGHPGGAHRHAGGRRVRSRNSGTGSLETSKPLNELSELPENSGGISKENTMITNVLPLAVRRPSGSGRTYRRVWLSGSSAGALAAGKTEGYVISSIFMTSVYNDPQTCPEGLNDGPDNKDVIARVPDPELRAKIAKILPGGRSGASDDPSRAQLGGCLSSGGCRLRPQRAFRSAFRAGSGYEDRPGHDLLWREFGWHPGRRGDRLDLRA